MIGVELIDEGLDEGEEGCNYYGDINRYKCGDTEFLVIVGEEGCSGGIFLNYDERNRPFNEIHPAVVSACRSTTRNYGGITHDEILRGAGFYVNKVAQKKARSFIHCPLF